MADAQQPEKKHKIQITVPEYYKSVSPDVWEELEEYLFIGFLTSFSRIHDYTIIFKTLNHREIRNLDYFRPMKKSPPEVRAAFRATFIAHSIFYIDGENTLFERPKHIRRLVDIVSKLDSRILEEIIENLNALNTKASRLHQLAEVYVNENRSRLKWLQIKNLPIHSPLATGIAGTDELGMNYCQQIWVALNQLQDLKESLENDWTNAKFIGSCFNPKGVRSLEERDKGRKQQEQQKQEEEKMKVLYAYLNRTTGGKDEGPPEEVMLPDGRMAKVEKRYMAESAEDLAEQLSSALSGEKDFHDRVVEQKQLEYRKRAAAIELQRRQFYQRPPVIDEAAQATSVPLAGGSRVLGGRAEVAEHLGKLRNIEHSKRALYQQVNLDLQPEDIKPYRRISDPSENSDKT